MNRIDGRAYDQLRPVKITPGFVDFAEGSVLIECGRTKVLCPGPTGSAAAGT